MGRNKERWGAWGWRTNVRWGEGATMKDGNGKKRREYERLGEQERKVKRKKR